MSVKLNLTGDKELLRALNQLGDKRTEYAVIGIAKEPAREIVRRAKKKIPRGKKGKGFGGESHRAGTARRGIKTRTMKRTRSGHKMVGQYVQVRGGRVDWFYFFHNALPMSDRSGKGRIQDPWGDVVKEAASEVDQSAVNQMERKIFKAIERQFKKAMR